MSNLIETACGHCGKTLKVPKNRAGQSGKCAYCGESVLIPYEDEVKSSTGRTIDTNSDFQQQQQQRQQEYAIPKAHSSAAYKQPKYKKQKKSATPTIVACSLVAFIIGNASGYLFSEHIDKILGISPNIANTNNSIVHVTPPKTINNNSTQPDVVDLNTTQQKDNSQQIAQTQQTLQKTQADLNELETAVKSLDKTSTHLFTKYRVNVEEEVYNFIENANKELKLGRNICENAQRVLQQNDENKLVEMIAQLEDASQRKQQLYGKIQQKNAELKKQLSKFDKSSSRKNGKISSKYMGKWYIKLLKSTRKVDVIYGRINITTLSASIKFRAIKNEIKMIKNYGRDIEKAAKRLTEKIDSGKDPFSWIEKRRQTARSIPQKQQADILEDFLKKGKKFIIDIESEYNQLAQAVRNIHKQSEKRLLAETTLRNILMSLQTINRKWQEEYQTFDSAIINFEIKD